MKILSDTHVLLWALSDPQQISPGIQKLLDDSLVYFSAISFYEIEIKRKLGKLEIKFDLEKLVTDGVVISLDISYEHCIATNDLPLIHKDPFDRLLIAQSVVEGIPLVTADKIIQQYDFAFIPA